MLLMDLRTLGMTLGRPSLIPQKFIRLDLPSPKSLISAPNNLRSCTDEISVNFYTATM